MPSTHLAVQILGGLALVLGAGCAGDSAPPPTATTAPTQTQATPATAATAVTPAGTPPPISTSAAGDLVSPPSIPRLAGPSKFTPSGLGYIEGVVGTGAVATVGQTVSVHYTGWLTDGRKFDSSRDRGQPFSFPLGRGQVIKGWDEGVAGMKVGGQRRLFIPASLGYGAQGAPPLIPGGASLVFDVELLGVR